MFICVRRLLTVGLILVSLWLGSSYAAAYWMTLRPHARFAEPVPAVPWATFEEHRLTTSDGADIGAWLANGEAGRPAVIVLHGHRGCRTGGLPLAQFFRQRGLPASSQAPRLRNSGGSGPG